MTASLQHDDLATLGLALPFDMDCSDALGLAAQSYLLTVSPQQKAAKPADIQQALETTEHTFGPFFSDVKADLKRGFQFWGALVSIVKAMQELPAEVVKDFTTADDWVKKLVVV